MPTPSGEIIQRLSPFRTAVSRPTLERMAQLMCGAILAPGARTVTACLRAAGLDEATDFASYHRVMSRAVWSPWVMSRILLGLLVTFLVPEGARLVFVIDDIDDIDDTLERRRGKKIRYESLFRDAVRSTKGQPVSPYGIRWVCIRWVCIRWVCLMLLVNTPWTERPWALPVITVPSLTWKRAAQLQERHRSPLGWARRLLASVRRWRACAAGILDARSCSSVTAGTRRWT